MEQKSLLKLNMIVAKGLKEIATLKNFFVRIKSYEDCAKLKEIENIFTEVEYALTNMNFPVLDITEEVNTKLYFDQVFTYGYASGWINISIHFNYALRIRKRELNRFITFSPGHVQLIKNLNIRFKHLENKIEEFFETKKVLTSLRNFQPFLTAVYSDIITIEFYSQNTAYTYLDNQLEHKSHFYFLDFKLITLIERFDEMKNDRVPKLHSYAVSIVEELSSKGYVDEVCPLFLLTAHYGFLSWEDYLNVDEIGINIKFNYSIIS